MTYLYKKQEQLNKKFKQIQLYEKKKKEKSESDLPWPVAACTLLLQKNLFIYNM